MPLPPSDALVGNEPVDESRTFVIRMSAQDLQVGGSGALSRFRAARQLVCQSPRGEANRAALRAVPQCRWSRMPECATDALCGTRSAAPPERPVPIFAAPR